MLDERKIEAMARLAIYEKGAGKEDIQMASYSRLDYIHYWALKTFLNVTLAMLLVFAMAVAYKADYFVKQVTSRNYGTYLFLGMAVYLLVLFISEIAAVFHALHRFQQSRTSLKNHYNNLRLLRRYYKEEEQGKNKG